VVPVFDEEGRVAELYGRKITPGLRPGTPLHLYLPGPHRGVWNLEALQASREIILCEALLDALTFWCAGFRNVTASYGVEGMTLDHWKAFERYGTERVLIAYDRDEAGEKAAEKLARQLTERGIGAYRIHFPKGMDANEYALKVTPAAKSLELLIRKALWLGKGKASAPSSQAAPATLPTTAKDETPGAPPEIVADAPTEASEPELEEPSLPLGAPGMNVRWRWKSSEKLGHRDLKRCCKAPTARRGLKEAASGIHEPTNRNRIRGGGDLRGERAYDREAPVTKEPDVDPAVAWGSLRSYPGRSRLRRKGRRRKAAREVSRGRSSRAPRRRAEREGGRNARESRRRTATEIAPPRRG